MHNPSQLSLREKIGLLVSFPIFIIMLILPAPPGLSPGGWHVLSSAILMAILWITEALPIPVTALLPLLLFPFFGVEKFPEVAKSYANSNIFLFMGGFFIAIAMQKWGLHRRIALYLIYLVGSSRRRIVLGFMIATAFLSMWISNTATTMMLYPIGLAVLLQLTEKNKNEEQTLASSDIDFRTALMLGIAYAASIGGIATLVGTPPNLVFIAALGKLYPNAPEISFLDWFVVGLILVVFFLPVCWLVLTNIAFKIDNKPIAGGRKLIREQLNKLGRMQVEEKIIAAVFAATALAWITRKDIAIGSFTIKGWASLLGVSGYVHDATVAIVAAFILFSIPTSLKERRFLLDWESAVKIPWGILVLFGGGIALAEGFRTSGLAEWFGGHLSLFGSVPLFVMILLTCATLTFITELTSNIATTTLFMPILASTATAIDANPLLLMIPATISASCAFMLPVATPPNAIIFASGYVTIPQMARTGIMLNLIGMVLIALLAYFVVIPLFGISSTSLPAWAH